MKTNLFIIMLILLCSCNSQKTISTTHIERIEERVKPIAIGADTLEITEYRLRSTNPPYSLLPTPYSLKSTRPINIQQTKTDSTSTLRITLRPDTVYLPYTTHIRSDTIVVQDRICKQKLTQSKTMNIILFIILILLVATIIHRKLSR